MESQGPGPSKSPERKAPCGSQSPIGSEFLTGYSGCTFGSDRPNDRFRADCLEKVRLPQPADWT